MMRPAFAALLAGLALIGGPVAAAAEEQTQPQPPQAVPAQPPGDTARYTFHRMGDAFVRLDSVTGQVAQCSQGPTTGWACAAAPEERAALESEIARLQRENAGLKKTLLARGDLPGAMAEGKPVPPGTVPDTTKPPDDLKLPSDAEVDRALAFMKSVWKKLVDMMMDLQRDIQQRKG
jgi:hypothetical protein